MPGAMDPSGLGCWSWAGYAFEGVRSGGSICRNGRWVKVKEPEGHLGLNVANALVGLAGPSIPLEDFSWSEHGMLLLGGIPLDAVKEDPSILLGPSTETNNFKEEWETGEIGTKIGHATSTCIMAKVALKPRPKPDVKVTRWQSPPSRQLTGGNWVVTGGRNPWNWLMSGKFNPLRPQHHVPFFNGRSFRVPRSNLRFPSGLEWFKGFWPFNQRRLIK